MKITTFFFLAASPILFSACNSSQTSESAADSTSTGDSTKHELVLKWETDSSLKVPESVLLDRQNKVLYVSNIDGQDPWKADGKGSIGKVDLDGKVISAEWVTGLESPKGLGMFNGKLYAADLTNLVIIDIASGKIEQKVPIAGAVGLNDIAVDGQGVLYISDSPGKRVFRFEKGKSEVFLDNLNGPNGLFINGTDIFVLDNQAMHKVNADRTLTKITDGLDGNADGLENVIGSDYIISCWEGLIWYINADGTKEMLLDTRAAQKNTADIGFDKETKTVYVPTFFKNTIVAYEVK
ncbi:SMP-30/gluconolactonase/LRE family protein [Daejeonella lutea]|uniref:SMP-30/Gluconolaconase/LRE-like region-containing protein n=1 Tax=Daejeonella lutea TaxID=572036 RepID=A0A1T5BA92_9SPHI|nr:SMP-30/gluconolactonase/LRE family protein [Daejeonella lutea]SKB44065.1 SMP-30/Gluconolaconase/LRE-like region-containing protein [Daejeonella lutea]